jgi:hypothetical protein
MRKSLEIADIVTVSTEFIKNYYSDINQEIIVIPNAHNDYNYPLQKVTETTDFINWRGSNTHRQDILSCAEEMVQLSRKYPDWAWSFIGNDLWYITDQIARHYNLKETDIISYHKYIKEIAPAIQIVPLVLSDFNRAKSNIAWLEGTYSGAATIAPDLPEFNASGCVNYTDKEGSFTYHLEKLICSKEYRQKKYHESFDHINDNLLLSKINQLRLGIVEKYS